MKKQNPDNKLAFNKAAVAELNVTELQEIKGGTSSFTIGTTSLIAVTLLQN